MNSALETTQLKDIVAHAKEYGFVFQSSEIYDGLAAVYDYGPNGVELKNNLKRLWWETMTQLHHDVVGIDAAIFMAPQTWEASGHVAGFNDPLIDNLDSKKRYRADVLVEEKIVALQKEIEGLKFKQSIPNSIPDGTWNSYEDRISEAENMIGLLTTALQIGTPHSLSNAIKQANISEPGTGSTNWTEARQFNLMYSTQGSAIDADAPPVYLRPETAQGIFVNFLNVQKSARMKIPFGIAQIGKAFRNEIVARQFIFRMREFEQMEMQFFVRPGTEGEWYDTWKAARRRFHEALGLPADKLRFHDHDKLAHYAKAAVDIEYEFPFGFKEIEGIHSRSDFDLAQHQHLSRKKQQYFDNDVDPATGKPYGNYVPYVVETSVGADRLFLATLCQAFAEETITEGEGEAQQTKTRTVLRLHPALAPVKAAIFPLVRKDGLPEKAQAIFDDLRFDFRLVLEERDAIGKRYTRQDLIGTPFCIAVDHQTLEDDTVTVRDRDSREQVRMPIAELRRYISEAVSFRRIFEKL
ncbi:glycine--tRNA ligase [Hymenobacter sp. BT664]|uniref:Glycine--tRNA ligase n=1 Tax=Hymenobacter montanus TaxID=2771359 RepID=A0A927GK39_9BACT|nr:glycine--tRNA ligase [Hymenobacter montanus]MBD2769163.1 glycine--tRNA ligase [Hymenobacter montanus]